MRIRRVLLIVLLPFFACVSASACGPFFPNAYLTYGREADILNIPRPYFSHELKAAVGISPPEAQWANPKKTSPWEQTLLADLADLTAALKARGEAVADVERIVRNYEIMRSAMQSQLPLPNVVPLPPDPYATLPESHTEDVTSSEHESTPFDLSSYDELLAELPTEFELYLRGAHAYRSGDPDKAVGFWRVLLSLPSEERQFKSTWSAYMLGKAHLDTDPVQSRAYFEEIETLVSAGYSDSLNLAWDGQGWIARSEGDAGDFTGALKRYLRVLQNGSERERQTAYVSLGWCCDNALRQPETLNAFTADATCRRVMTAWVAALGFRWLGKTDTNTWLDAMAAMKPEAPVEGADRLAWIAYRNGDMDIAQRWVDLADPDAPYALWVHSKILLRKGLIDEGMDCLRKAAVSFPPEDSWASGYVAKMSPFEIAHAELGVLLLGRGEYIDAMDHLLRSGYWLDAAYVAERVLTIDELAEYIRNHANDPALAEPVDPFGLWELRDIPRFDMLRYVLARRLLRDNRWDDASSLLPEDAASAAAELKQILTAVGSGKAAVSLDDWGGDIERYMAKLEGSPQNRKVDESKAQAYFDAAKLVRHRGMELIGTEVQPDWHAFRGRYELDGTSSFRLSGKTSTEKIVLDPALKHVLTATEDEKRRAAAHAPELDRRFHYRYLAAHLMWRSAGLFPDDDIRTANALYSGGMYIKDRDPQAADKFYKALVWRNLNLPYAQTADKKRWFPDEPPE